MITAANDDDPRRLQVHQVELQAYAEGRLDERRRREIEGYLACNPDVAAQVMRHLHMGGRAGARLRRRGPLVLACAMGLAVCLGSGLGWAAAERRGLDGWRELDGGRPPGYVEEAAEARAAADLRAGMASPLETPSLDPGEVRERLRIEAPRLPAHWRVRDAQVFPTDAGPGVHLVIEPREGGRLQLFAVRVAGPEKAPELAERAGERVVFWQSRGSAYVLSGQRPGGDLAADARLLGAANRHGPKAG